MNLFLKGKEPILEFCLIICAPYVSEEIEGVQMQRSTELLLRQQA